MRVNTPKGVQNFLSAKALACVAWRFCRAGRAPISSRFLCPRPPLLLSAPNQNRHATQATNAPEVKRTWYLSVSDRTHPRVSATLSFSQA